MTLTILLKKLQDPEERIVAESFGKLAELRLELRPSGLSTLSVVLLGTSYVPAALSYFTVV